MLDKLRHQLKTLLFLRVVRSLATLLWRLVAYTRWLSVDWGEAQVGPSRYLLRRSAVAKLLMMHNEKSALR
ncbi:hypothetical protein DM02DRAFT_678259 [Periconia macrospinosa]|uniref:Uncharacterized protein n=1 Tax=Periconia macrospinosa TaxID=97972 RepID=A0A2V1CZ77_9PLEO|nr:hypothetical protein DM02DRAFT_678259 [Periconia macrospinosa]